MSGAKDQVSVTLPLYRWLMLIGVLGNLNDQGWYDGLVDQILDKVQP